MKYFLLVISCITLIGGCMVMPEKDQTYTNKCEMFSDRKTL
ncbi:hypothetical protein [Rheinheimera mangrovi]|nr:hypothetical protein [Rheinheimera mangrovi]